MEGIEVVAAGVHHQHQTRRVRFTGLRDDASSGSCSTEIDATAIDAAGVGWDALAGLAAEAAVLRAAEIATHAARRRTNGFVEATPSPSTKSRHYFSSGASDNDRLDGMTTPAAYAPSARAQKLAAAGRPTTQYKLVRGPLMLAWRDRSYGDVTGGRNSRRAENILLGNHTCVVDAASTASTVAGASTASGAWTRSDSPTVISSVAASETAPATLVSQLSDSSRRIPPPDATLQPGAAAQVVHVASLTASLRAADEARAVALADHLAWEREHAATMQQLLLAAPTSWTSQPDASPGGNASPPVDVRSVDERAGRLPPSAEECSLPSAHVRAATGTASPPAVDGRHRGSSGSIGDAPEAAVEDAASWTPARGLTVNGGGLAHASTNGSLSTSLVARQLVRSPSLALSPVAGSPSLEAATSGTTTTTTMSSSLRSTRSPPSPDRDCSPRATAHESSPLRQPQLLLPHSAPSSSDASSSTFYSSNERLASSDKRTNLPSSASKVAAVIARRRVVPEQALISASPSRLSASRLSADRGQTLFGSVRVLNTPPLRARDAVRPASLVAAPPAERRDLCFTAEEVAVDSFIMQMNDASAPAAYTPPQRGDREADRADCITADVSAASASRAESDDMGAARVDTEGGKIGAAAAADTVTVTPVAALPPTAVGATTSTAAAALLTPCLPLRSSLAAHFARFLSADAAKDLVLPSSPSPTLPVRSDAAADAPTPPCSAVGGSTEIEATDSPVRGLAAAGTAENNARSAVNHSPTPPPPTPPPRFFRYMSSPLLRRRASAPLRSVVSPLRGNPTGDQGGTPVRAGFGVSRATGAASQLNSMDEFEFEPPTSIEPSSAPSVADRTLGVDAANRLDLDAERATRTALDVLDRVDGSDTLDDERHSRSEDTEFTATSSREDTRVADGASVPCAADVSQWQPLAADSNGSASIAARDCFPSALLSNDIRVADTEALDSAPPVRSLAAEFSQSGEDDMLDEQVGSWTWLHIPSHDSSQQVHADATTPLTNSVLNCDSSRASTLRSRDQPEATLPSATAPIRGQVPASAAADETAPERDGGDQASSLVTSAASAADNASASRRHLRRRSARDAAAEVLQDANTAPKYLVNDLHVSRTVLASLSTSHAPHNPALAVDVPAAASINAEAPIPFAPMKRARHTDRATADYEDATIHAVTSASLTVQGRSRAMTLPPNRVRRDSCSSSASSGSSSSSDLRGWMSFEGGAPRTMGHLSTVAPIYMAAAAVPAQPVLLRLSSPVAAAATAQRPSDAFASGGCHSREKLEPNGASATIDAALVEARGESTLSRLSLPPLASATPASTQSGLPVPGALLSRKRLAPAASSSTRMLPSPAVGSKRRASDAPPQSRHLLAPQAESTGGTRQWQSRGKDTTSTQPHGVSTSSSPAAAIGQETRASASRAAAPAAVDRARERSVDVDGAAGRPKRVVKDLSTRRALDAILGSRPTRETNRVTTASQLLTLRPAATERC